MEAIRLPLLPLRGNNFILFPSVEHAIDLARPTSLSTINKAIDVGSRIVIGFHKNLAVKNTKARISDFWETGCEATIKGITDLKDGAKRIFVEGVSRVKLGAVYTDREGATLCDFTYVEETKFEMTDHLGELFLYLQNLALGLENTAKFSPMGKPVTSEELGKYIDAVTFRVRLTGEEKVRILRCGDIRKRIEMFHILLANLVEQENERLAEQAYRDMAKQNNISLDSNNEVKSSVGTSPLDLKEGELNRLMKLVQEASMSDEANSIASNELQRLQMMPTSSSEYSITVSYLDTLASLPWKKMTEEKIDINEAKKILDEDHYGLEKPKDRILEFLAVRKLTAKSSGAILCFAGPPGVGKTSLGQSIARAMGRKFIRTSFGGVKDEAEIRGHRRTYIGALPGRIIQEIKKSGTKNPVFMLDEIDKLGHDSVHGDPSAALLEVLDPEQNFSFKDNYLGVGFDLSQVFFIGTANDVYGMPSALRDRMDIVDLSGYSAFTKTYIARHHLIPKQKVKNGLDTHDINISDEALHHIIESYTYEAGVRTLERQIGSIFRKLAVNVTSDKEIPNPIGKEEVKSLLGPPKLFVQRMSNEPSVGISTGLAWSPSGGSILFVESVAIPGEGKIELTGNMGQVLQESAKASHTWIRANAELFGINSEYAEKASIHVHLPAGATPKDGPSAGVALTVSVVSLLSKIPVRNDIAMTGEISLRGRIMPVGGIVEKLLAAHRAGIREVIIPKDNADSLNDVPDEILKEMKVHLMSELVDAVKLALVNKI